MTDINFDEFGFADAKRKEHKAKIALYGPSGSGKTYNALKIAYVLTNGGKVGVIDTENSSSGLYCDMATERDKNPEMDPDWTFKEYNFQPGYDPQKLTALINKAGPSFDCLIIDSLSAFWNGEGGLLEIVDNATKNSKSGNSSMIGWKKGTPIHAAMVESILRAKCHIIVCMRSKMQFEAIKDSNGRLKVQTLGLGPIQKDTTIYEMTIAASIDQSHSLNIEKTRCSKVDGFTYSPTSSSKTVTHFATEIRDWLSTSEGAEENARALDEASAKLTEVANADKVEDDLSVESDHPDYEYVDTPTSSQTEVNPAQSKKSTDDLVMEIKAYVSGLDGGGKSEKWMNITTKYGFGKIAEVTDTALLESILQDLQN